MDINLDPSNFSILRYLLMSMSIKLLNKTSYSDKRLFQLGNFLSHLCSFCRDKDKTISLFLYCSNASGLFKVDIFNNTDQCLWILKTNDKKHLL